MGKHLMMVSSMEEAGPGTDFVMACPDPNLVRYETDCPADLQEWQLVVELPGADRPLRDRQELGYVTGRPERVVRHGGISRVAAPPR
jgi:hypothetical protein